MIYAFANKFLNIEELEKVKGMLKMTQLGRSLMDEGKEEWKAKGKAEMLIMLLNKKFKKIPKDIKIKIFELDEDVLDTLALDIFDITDIKAIKQYL